jgi:hypothetical protein
VALTLPRHDPEVSALVEVLDARLAEASFDVDKAWTLVNDEELLYIDRELERCIKDRRYYLENYHAIKDEQGRLQTLWPFWDHQEIIFSHLQNSWATKGCFRGIILKPRQCGGTVWSSGIAFHATIFTPQAFTLLMAHDSEASAEIDRRVRVSFDNLPWWMKPDILSRQQERQWIFERSSASRRGTNPGLGSTILISDSQRKAGVAIGRTVRVAHFSEVSRWEDASTYTADIKPSMNARDILAIMESTAYGRNGLFFNQWRAAEAGKSAWEPIFIPVYRVKKYFIPVLKSDQFELTEEEKKLRVTVKEKDNFTIPLGFFNWRRNDIQETINSTGDPDANDHFEAYPISPGEAFISSGFGAFPKNRLNEQEKLHCRPPLFIGEIEYNGPDNEPILKLHKPLPEELLEKASRVNRLWIWELPDENDAVEYYIGCLPDGEEVITQAGLKPIEAVTDDDLLLDKNGDYVPIKARLRRLYNGELYEIRSVGCPFPVRLTPEHPVLVIRDWGEEWIPAKDIVVGDIVRTPRYLPHTTLQDYFESIWTVVKGKRRNKILGPNVCCDLRFWWFVGLFLADGWVNHQRQTTYTVTIALNAKKEEWLADKLQDVIESLFEREVSRRITDDNVIEIKFSCVEVAEFLRGFGKGAVNKIVPWWVFGLPLDFQSELLHGYWDGDGSMRAHQGRSTLMICTSISYSLLYGMQRIMLALGYFASLRVLREGGICTFRGKTYKQAKCYELCLGSFPTNLLLSSWGIDSGLQMAEFANSVMAKVYPKFLCGKVTKVSTSHYEGYVNNFETTSHSYCSRLMTVHNCDVAGGSGPDYSDAEVYKLGYGPEPHTQVAEWHGFCNPSHFARIIAALGYWYHSAEVAVEYMKAGVTTGDELLWQLDYPNLYRWKHLDKIAGSTTLHVHWMTTSRTRDDAINRTNEALLDRQIVIRNRHVIEEMRDFGRLEGEGKAAGLDNEDDMVMGTLICICAAHQTGKKFNEEFSSSSASHVMPKTPEVIGLYDHLMRQIGQFEGMDQARKFMEGEAKKYKGSIEWVKTKAEGGPGGTLRATLKVGVHAAFTLREIAVMRANTSYSPALDGGGAEHELYSKYGMDPRHQTSDLVQMYREMLTRQHYEGGDD